MDFQNGNFAHEETFESAQQAQQPQQAPEVRQNMQPEKKKTENLFSKLFRTRIKVCKDHLPILNVSSLFVIFSALCSFGLVAVGALVCFLLGYQFSIEKNSPDFSGNFKDMVKDAGTNVQNAVNSFTGTEA